MRAPGALAACALVVLAGAACGSAPASYTDSHSAAQILTDASTSTAAVSSYHIKIEETTESGDAMMDVDVEGTNISGKLTAEGIAARITHVGDQTFVYGADLAAILGKTNPQAGAVVTAKAADKWVLMPSNFWDSSFTDVLDVKKMSTCLSTVAGAVKKGTSTVSGVSAIEIDDQLLSQIDVQTASPHYYVHMVFTGVETCLTDSTARGQTIDLSSFGKKFGITAPAGYVDLTTLAGS